MRRVKADAWPWQDGYDWRGRIDCTTPLNQMDNGRGARFGAGWNWKLGIAMGSGVIMMDLLFGTIWIRWGTPKVIDC